MRPTLCKALIMGLLPLSVMAAELREISGSVLYRERMALPPEAELVLELRDTAGLVVTRESERTDGAQVPLPFTIGGAANMPLTLHAALRMDGDVRWLAEPVTIEAGQETTGLGEIMLRAIQPMGIASKLTCGEIIAELGIIDQTARLRIGSTYLDLEARPTASGSRYVSPGDESTWVSTDGDVTTLSLNGVEMPACYQMLPEARYAARGNEPGWTVVFENGQMRYLGDYGATEVTVPLPELQIVDGAHRYAVEDLNLAVRISRELCHDDMAGMPYPDRAVVEIGERELRGCAGDPLDLLSAHPWRVEDITGKGIIDSSEVTLRFGRDAQVAGRAGCNSYRAAFSLTGEGLSVGPTAATRMACPEALMEQERRFLDALARVSHFDLSDTGELQLMAGGDRVLSARR